MGHARFRKRVRAMKPHARRGSTAAELAAFVNALREVRGQEPLYADQDGRYSHARRRPTVEEQEAARFYVVHGAPWERADAQGRAR